MGSCLNLIWLYASSKVSCPGYVTSLASTIYAKSEYFPFYLTALTANRSERKKDRQKCRSNCTSLMAHVLSSHLRRTTQIIDNWLEYAQNTVVTPQGKVSGFKTGNAYRYTVPYAKSPIGQLRFKVKCQIFQASTRHAECLRLRISQPPTPIPNWSGT